MVRVRSLRTLDIEPPTSNIEGKKMSRRSVFQPSTIHFLQSLWREKAKCDGHRRAATWDLLCAPFAAFAAWRFKFSRTPNIKRPTWNVEGEKMRRRGMFRPSTIHFQPSTFFRASGGRRRSATVIDAPLHGICFAPHLRPLRLGGSNFLERPTSNTQHRTPNIERPTSNVQHRTSNIER